jgi:hypothetical protein
MMTASPTPTLASAVDDLYASVLGDPAFTPYFVEADVRRLEGHRQTFVNAVLGAPDVALTDGAVDCVVDHLVATLENLGVPSAVVGAVSAPR